MTVGVLDVSEAELGIVREILARVVPGRRVWAFGSRVTALPQEPTRTLDTVTHDARYTLTRLDRTCVFGPIVKSDATALTVKPYNEVPVTIARSDIAQVSQGLDLVYSSLSSWYDVIHVHVYPGETLVVVTQSGKTIKGTPTNTTADSITLRHGFTTTVYKKEDIARIDWLRKRPATDNFEFVLEEAPWAIIFYPEFYSRVTGLEGRIPVRLYDSSKPETKLPPHCR